MAVSKEDILETISNMSVMDVVDLISAMEAKFGVSAAAPVAVAAGPAAEVAVAEEQTEFNVILASFGASKVPVIKTIREITGLGLKEAKDLVESAPTTVRDGVSAAEAAELKTKLESAGATVEIK